MQQSLDRALHELGLIEHNVAFESTWDIRKFGYLLANPIDHRNRVRIASLLEDRQVDRALPVDSHDVVLQRLRVPSLADVPDAHRRLPHHLERQLIDVRDPVQHAVV